jgi:YbgC/YbaW family acyl-CoA thioester hydrolase
MAAEQATVVTIPVRSTDMDADQIVNNAVYFVYFEQARLVHLQRLGVIQRPRRPGVPARAFTIAATNARYLAPTVHPDALEITVQTAEVRNRSFTLAFQAVRVSDGVRVVEGSSAQVWLDTAGRPALLPDDVREPLLRSVLPPETS